MNFKNLTRRSFVAGAAAGISCLGLGLFAPARALAEHSSDELQAQVEAARAQLDSMGAGLAAMQQQLMDAEHAVETTRAQIAETEDKISQTTADLEARRTELSSIMASSYKSGDNALTALSYVLGATSAEDLVSRVYYMDKVSEKQASAIESVKTLGEQLEQEKSDLLAQQDEQQATIDSTTASVEEYQSQVASAQAYLDGLDAQVQEALAREAAEEAASSNVSTAIQAVEQNKVVEQNQQSSGNSSGENSGAAQTPSEPETPATPDPEPEPTPDPGTSGGGSGASDSSVIGYASALIGKPYLQWWAGVNYGPGAAGYDCCGLVATAYHMAGYALPYQTSVPGLMSYVQSRGNYKTCSLSNYQSVLNPGDLIFCSTGHVAIYCGGNQMIHANYPGGSVVQSSVYACIGGGFGG